jgi:hypothetical protein
MTKILTLASIFDSNFLPQALVFYDSVKEFVNDYQIFFLCLDDKTYDTLEQLKLKGVKLIRHEDFADNELRRLKRERKPGEYSWTCKGPLVEYLFRRFKLKEVIYLDIDMCFWAKPDAMLEELKDVSIGITRQRLSLRYQLMEKRSGKFNAGFIYFRNDKTANKCLKKWSRQCRNWCYSRLENGKLGDQMYLNKWPSLYKGKLKILENEGVNSACFNTDGEEVLKNRFGIYINGNRLILFHYHGFVRLGQNKYLANEVFQVSQKLNEIVFVPYAKELEKRVRLIKKIWRAYKPLVNKKSAKQRVQNFLYKTILDITSWKNRL